MEASAGSFERLMTLLSLQADGLLDDREWEELGTLIAGSEEACDLYVEHMFVHTLMHQAARLKSGPGVPTDSLASLPDMSLPDETWGEAEPRSGSTVLGFLETVFRAGANGISRPLVLTLLLAVGLPFLMLFILAVDINRQRGRPIPVAHIQQPDADQASQVIVAEIRSTHQAVWGKGDEGCPSDNRLAAGKTVRLREGLADIEFTDGAKVVLRGPAVFRTIEASRALLNRGSLTATVPVAARGFTVKTPLAEIVDLGTEFGVAVAADGREEAHVFKGEIELVTREAANQPAVEPTRLEAGQAVEISLSETNKAIQVVDIAAQPERFTRRFVDGLGEPTILFTHHGDKHPKNEGWYLVNKGIKNPGKIGSEIGPVTADGVSAWAFHNQKKTSNAYYQIADAQGLTPELVAEANQKGWMYRVRVWVSDQLPHPQKGLGLISYRNDERSWGLHLALDKQGNQCLVVYGFVEQGAVSSNNGGSVPVPNSRGRYVDYEVRYDPATKDTRLLINGRVAITNFACEKIEKIGHYPVLRIGMDRSGVFTNLRIAEFEWGIYRGPGDVGADPLDKKPNHKPADSGTKESPDNL